MSTRPMTPQNQGFPDRNAVAAQRRVAEFRRRDRKANSVPGAHRLDFIYAPYASEGACVADPECARPVVVRGMCSRHAAKELS